MTTIDELLHRCETFTLIPWLEDKFEPEYILVQGEETKHKLSTIDEVEFFEMLESIWVNEEHLTIEFSDETLVVFVTSKWDGKYRD